MSNKNERKKKELEMIRRMRDIRYIEMRHQKPNQNKISYEPYTNYIENKMESKHLYNIHKWWAF